MHSLRSLIETRPTSIPHLAVWLLFSPFLFCVAAPLYHLSQTAVRISRAVQDTMVVIGSRLREASAHANSRLWEHTISVLERVREMGFGVVGKHMSAGTLALVVLGVALVPVLGVVVVPGLFMGACYWLAGFWLFYFLSNLLCWY
ncbi:hypothetical protein BC830DRAFT_243230 [Chytriomyces sp. MP71]|nr:hypothetical protein BC830DRAFT_243230 [Chytriomyces sp. MP71]